MPHAALYLFSPVLNYLLNNSAWGKGIISGYKKAEFFYTLLAVMLLSKIEDMFWSVLSQVSKNSEDRNHKHIIRTITKSLIWGTGYSHKPYCPQMAFPVALWLMSSLSIWHTMSRCKTALACITNIWLLLALFKKHKACYTISATMGLFH